MSARTILKIVVMLLKCFKTVSFKHKLSKINEIFLFPHTNLPVGTITENNQVIQVQKLLQIKMILRWNWKQI